MHWLCGTCQRQTLEAQVERAQARAMAEVDAAQRTHDDAVNVALLMRGSQAADPFNDAVDATKRALDIKRAAFARGAAPACPICAQPVLQTLSFTRGARGAAAAAAAPAAAAAET